jgi:hypothetical protein
MVRSSLSVFDASRKLSPKTSGSAAAGSATATTRPATIERRISL